MPVTVPEVIQNLSATVSLLELDDSLIKEHKELLEKSESAVSALCSLQFLINSKQAAISEATEINKKLKFFISLLESHLKDPSIASTQQAQLLAKNPASQQQPPISEIPVVSPISPEEWSSVPRYMIGKLTCQKVNEYISLLNSMLSELIRIQRAVTIPSQKLTVTREQKERLSEYKRSVNQETVGKSFLLESEVKKQGELSDLAIRSMNTILRHFSRIKEVRGGGHNRLVPQLQ